VLLALLADEEGLHVGAAGERGARDRVGAHRQAADRGGADLARLLGHQLAERAEAFRPQDRPLRVYEVLRHRPARERHLTDHERVLAQLARERFAGAQSDLGRARRPRSQPSQSQSG
jgi:hypothetical protein